MYRLIRGEKVIVDGMTITSMRHMKDEVNSIKKDVECGLRFDYPEDTPIFKFQPQDKLVCYTVGKVNQKTKWIPKGFK